MFTRVDCKILTISTIASRSLERHSTLKSKLSPVYALIHAQELKRHNNNFVLEVDFFGTLRNFHRSIVKQFRSEAI